MEINFEIVLFCTIERINDTYENDPALILCTAYLLNNLDGKYNNYLLNNFLKQGIVSLL